MSNVITWGADENNWGYYVTPDEKFDLESNSVLIEKKELQQHGEKNNVENNEPIYENIYFVCFVALTMGAIYIVLH